MGALSEELADLELDEDLLKSASDDEDLNPRPRTTDLSASVQDTFMSLVFAPFDAESCNTHLGVPLEQWRKSATSDDAFKRPEMRFELCATRILPPAQ